MNRFTFNRIHRALRPSKTSGRDYTAAAFPPEGTPRSTPVATTPTCGLNTCRKLTPIMVNYSCILIHIILENLSGFDYKSAPFQLAQLNDQSHIAALEGRDAEAVQLANLAILAAQDRPEGYEAVANAHLSAARPLEASKALAYALKRWPTAAYALFLEGFRLGEAGDFAEALKFLDLSLCFDAHNPEALRNKGWYTFLGGNAALGESILLDALKSPKAADASDLIYLDLANVMLQTKRFDDAIRFAQNALTCNPGLKAQVDRLLQIATDYKRAFDLLSSPKTT